jgi:hypothetical protein
VPVMPPSSTSALSLGWRSSASGWFALCFYRIRAPAVGCSTDGLQPTMSLCSFMQYVRGSCSGIDGAIGKERHQKEQAERPEKQGCEGAAATAKTQRISGQQGPTRAAGQCERLTGPIYGRLKRSCSY